LAINVGQKEKRVLRKAVNVVQKYQKKKRANDKGEASGSKKEDQFEYQDTKKGKESLVVRGALRRGNKKKPRGKGTGAPVVKQTANSLATSQKKL